VIRRSPSRNSSRTLPTKSEIAYDSLSSGGLAGLHTINCFAVVIRSLLGTSVAARRYMRLLPRIAGSITRPQCRMPAVVLFAVGMLACGCGNQVTPTHPGPTVETTAGALNASGSGSDGTFALQVTRSGTGSGTVTSNPSGISCGTNCSRSSFGGTTVTP
jgi:hypothetical protein